MTARWEDALARIAAGERNVRLDLSAKPRETLRPRVTTSGWIRPVELLPTYELQYRLAMDDVALQVAVAWTHTWQRYVSGRIALGLSALAHGETKQADNDRHLTYHERRPYLPDRDTIVAELRRRGIRF